jgi:fructose-1,6-bisphosphatase II
MMEALLRACERAAVAVQAAVGRGDKHRADEVAVAAMRRALAEADFEGTVVIGEGEMDEAPMLYIGERLGRGGEKLDIAVDPLEGTELAAKGQPGAVAVLAAAQAGALLHAPDVYMEKMVVGPAGRGLLEPDLPPGELVRRLARAKGGTPAEITVAVLERDRHQALVAEIRAAGGRVRLLPHGDVMPAVATCLPSSGIDAVLGIGGAPEGVLAAVAVAQLGGDFLGRLRPSDDEERRRIEAMGADTGVLRLADLCAGPAVFVASAVTEAYGLPAPLRRGGHWEVHSLVVDGRDGTVRRVRTELGDV